MAETDEKGWYLFQAGERLGPFAGDELKRLAAVGKMKPDGYLWRQGEPRHYQVSEFPELRKRVRDYNDPTGYAPAHRAEVEIVDAPPPALEKDWNYSADTDETPAADPWSVSDQAAKSVSRQDTGYQSKRGSRSGTMKPVAEFEQISEVLRPIFGKGSVKPRTAIFFLLGILIPLRPFSLILFWFLAYRSYKE